RAQVQHLQAEPQRPGAGELVRELKAVRARCDQLTNELNAVRADCARLEAERQAAVRTAEQMRTRLREMEKVLDEEPTQRNLPDGGVPPALQEAYERWDQERQGLRAQAALDRQARAEAEQRAAQLDITSRK